MGFSCGELIKAIPKDKYKVLKFGGTPSVGISIPGRLNIKGVEKLYKNYCIPNEEQVVAHLIRSSPLGTDGVLITDRAIYLNPASCSGKPSNCILWSDLHEFFVVHACDHARVALAKPKEKISYSLLKPTLDIAPGNELVDFVLKMQHSILAEHPELQEERVVQFEAFKIQCEEIMDSGSIDSLRLSILTYLLLEPKYVEQTAVLMAIDYAKAHTENQYSQWIDSLPETLSDDLRKRLKELWFPTIKKFISALEDKSIQFDLEYLEGISKNLSQEDNPSLEMAYLAGLLSVRLKKWDVVDFTISNLKGRLPIEQMGKLCFPRYSVANAQMQQVLVQIKESKTSLKKDMLFCFDSMRLTPYHYAIIFENPKVRADLLHSKKWPELSQEQTSAFGEIGIYDYLCLAIYKELPYEDLKQIAIRTSEEATSIQKRISTQQAVNAAGEAVQFLGDFLLTSATNTKTENYARVKDDMADLSDRTNEQKEMIQETEMKLRECLDELFFEAEQKVVQWKESRDPVVRYLLHLYSDPEYLEKIISTSGEWTLYRTTDGFCYMAPSGEIEKHRILDVEDAILESEKPNGDSWFSAEAHVDAEVLKKEFRLLAKKYHPDVSTDPQASAIFQEISAEQEKIQQELENQ